METYRYILLRYRPSPDVGEFINIGVLVGCAANGYLGHRLQNARDARCRLNAIAPGFDTSTLKTELEYIASGLRAKQTSLDPDGALAFYAKIQEGIFFCGDQGSVFWDGLPDDLADELFRRFVCGGRPRCVSDESEMVSQIRALIAQKPWRKLYRKREYRNDNGYEISLPFVSEFKAAKPLGLAEESYTALKDKTLIWRERFRMFREQLPERVFAPYVLSRDDSLNAFGRVFMNEIESEFAITPVDVSAGLSPLADLMAPAV